MTAADKGAFPHFLIKEIFEQPRAVRDTVLGRVSPESGMVSLEGIPRDEFAALKRINIAASGTSRHAGMAGRFMIQELAAIPVEVDYASEFEYRSVPGLGELTVVITQSGETAVQVGDAHEGQAGHEEAGDAICRIELASVHEEDLGQQ